MTVFRDSYEELVEYVADTGSSQIEELSALEAAVCGPGGHLWLAADSCRVYRVRPGGRKKRGLWRLDREHPLDTEMWVSRKLKDGVLGRLQAPQHSREYALDPGLAEKDLAALAELERVWLAGGRRLRLLEPADVPLRGEYLIGIRIKDIEADLARAKALRARNLIETFGDDPARVAAELGIGMDAARDALAVREKYHTWIRAGAAASRQRFPVRKPAGPTGLPDDLATRLMTAACDTETVLPGKAYPRPLPADLAPWHVYIEAIGHSIAVAVDDLCKPDGDPWEYMAVAPVRTVLREGWIMRNGLVLVRVPYDTIFGTVVEYPEEDREF